MDWIRAAEDIQAFLLEAGAFALEKQKGVATVFKEDDSALTETDLAVSRMAQAKLAGWLGKMGHVLIDEESIKLTPKEVLGASDYQWVLDPIDGTAGYGLGRRMWGITLGLMHNGKPMVGGLYLPRIGELLMTDGEGSYRVDPVTLEKERLETEKMPVNSQTFVESFFGGNIGWGKGFGDSKIWMNRPESAVQSFHSVLMNEAAAAVLGTGYSIWDVAGAVALAKHTGLKVLNMDDGREWVAFEAKDFTAKWKLAENWVMVEPDNYADVVSGLKI